MEYEVSVLIDLKKEKALNRDMLAITAQTVVSTEYLSEHVRKFYNGLTDVTNSVKVNTTSGGPSLSIEMLHTLTGSGIQSMTCLYNLTGNNLTVISRSGIKNVFKPMLGHYQGKVIIRQIHCLLDVNSPMLDKYYNKKEVPQHMHHEFKEIQDAYFKTRQGPAACFNPNNPRYIFVLSDAIVPEELIEKNGSVYVNNRDLGISFDDVENTPNHPFDDLEASKEAVDKALSGQTGTGLLYEIIDNEKKYGDRYAIFGKRVVKIKATQNPLKGDGVYVYSTYMDENKKDITSVSFSLEDADEKLGLYKTEREAITGGDISTSNKKELEELQHRNSVLTIDNNKKKMEYEQNLLKLKETHANKELEYKEQISNIERQDAELKRQMQLERERWEFEKLRLEKELHQYKHNTNVNDYVRKDYYEDRSYHRKDRSEEIKFWPIALTAVFSAMAGAYAVFRK